MILIRIHLYAEVSCVHTFIVCMNDFLSTQNDTKRYSEMPIIANKYNRIAQNCAQKSLDE